MKHSIAIDGPAGAGKSTVAKELARVLGINYLNTGAMYRALALYALERGISPSDESAVSSILNEAVISVKYEGEEQRTLLNGRDCTEQLRSEAVSMATSDISRHRAVRDRMAGLQREIALRQPLVLEGRDIGTNVLYDAPHKFFVTASAEERARRRQKQLDKLGVSAEFQTILADIIARDRQDSGREYMPLKRADDAVLIDTTDLSIEEAVEAIKKRIEGA
ncbi:MAG: (d)CMP kinase [Clostridia bacterium]|nr:(d)CMP kinase [Clostridia bacterium]